jgi:hypothetical protein
MGEAAKFAAANGGKTLEQTFAGKVTSKITANMKWENASPFWDMASKGFAKGSKSSTVHAFQSSERVGLESVWRRIEYPILQSKQTDIIFHITK